MDKKECQKWCNCKRIKEQLELAKPLLRLEVPKLIEADFYPFKLDRIEKEIELIKKADN